MIPLPVGEGESKLVFPSHRGEGLEIFVQAGSLAEDPALNTPTNLLNLNNALTQYLHDLNCSHKKMHYYDDSLKKVAAKFHFPDTGLW